MNEHPPAPEDGAEASAPDAPTVIRPHEATTPDPPTVVSSSPPASPEAPAAAALPVEPPPPPPPSPGAIPAPPASRAMPAPPTQEPFPAPANGAASAVGDRPELAVGAAFVSGFVLALILRRLAR